MEETAKYFVALAKLHSNDEEIIKLIKEKLIELVNIEIDNCLAIVDEQKNEWNETAVRVNRITDIISGKMKNRKM